MREIEVISVPKRHPAFARPGQLPVMEPSLVQPSQLKGRTCLNRSKNSPCCWLAGNPTLPKTRHCEWHAETLGYVNGRPAKGDLCLSEGAEDMPEDEFAERNRAFVARLEDARGEARAIRDRSGLGRPLVVAQLSIELRGEL